MCFETTLWKQIFEKTDKKSLAILVANRLRLIKRVPRPEILFTTGIPQQSCCDRAINIRFDAIMTNDIWTD